MIVPLRKIRRYLAVTPKLLFAFVAMQVACAPTLEVPLNSTPTAIATASARDETEMPMPTITLPTPRARGPLSLEETLAQRRSIREFSDAPLTPFELSQLLWAAQGITSDEGFRTAPSAGALYPLEVYAATPDGVYYYLPRGHRLRAHLSGDVRSALYAAALGQDAVRQAPLVIVIAAVYSRTARKYGVERSSRYVHLEAGHCAQNVLLQAVALNLGAVPIGAFWDEQVKRALNLPPDHEPLYLIPVGHPR